MRKLFVAALLLLPLSAGAQQMDMDAMMKWASADVVRYHVVGVYQGTPHIAGDGSGLGEVSDRVVMDFTWKLSEMKLVGAPTFQNTKTVVGKLRDREAACLPPVLKGEYQHYEVLGIKDGLGGALELTVQTVYPVVEVAQSCTASRKSVPGKKNVRPEEFTVISPVTFGMPVANSNELSISPDKKSLITKKNGWTWTLTPTAVAK